MRSSSRGPYTRHVRFSLINECVQPTRTNSSQVKWGRHPPPSPPTHTLPHTNTYTHPHRHIGTDSLFLSCLCCIYSYTHRPLQLVSRKKRERLPLSLLLLMLMSPRCLDQSRLLYTHHEYTGTSSPTLSSLAVVVKSTPFIRRCARDSRGSRRRARYVRSLLLHPCVYISLYNARDGQHNYVVNSPRENELAATPTVAGKTVIAPGRRPTAFMSAVLSLSLSLFVALFLYKNTLCLTLSLSRSLCLSRINTACVWTVLWPSSLPTGESVFIRYRNKVALRLAA